MKTFESLEERIVAGGSSPPEEPRGSRLRDPRTAALLSLVPGLGQLYNGETGKGTLFLAVTATNLSLLLFLIFAKPFFGWLEKVVSSAGFKVNLDLVQTPDVAAAAGAVGLIYLALVICFVTYAAREAYDHALQSRQGAVFAKYFLGLPEATSGSYLFHFSVMAVFMIMVIFVVAPRPPEEQTTVIELVPEPPPPPPPPPPEPEPPKPKAAAKPTAEPPPPPQAPPTPEPPAPEPTPAPIDIPSPVPVAVAPPFAPASDASSSTAGGTGSDSGAPASDGGGGGGDSDEVDFGAYLSQMQRKIKKAWFPPKGNESKRITVKFKLNRAGEVSKVRLVNSSGLSIADDAAITALKTASPFGPLPDGAPDQVEIKFTFDYNVFGGGQAALK